MPEINLKMKKLIPEKITAYYKIECVYGVMAFTALLIAGCKLRILSIDSSGQWHPAGNSDDGDLKVMMICGWNRHQHILSLTSVTNINITHPATVMSPTSILNIDEVDIDRVLLAWRSFFRKLIGLFQLYVLWYIGISRSMISWKGNKKKFEEYWAETRDFLES